MCFSQNITLYFTFIVNYEATLREQKAIKIESKFDGYKTITDRNNTRTTFAQDLRARSEYIETHTYTHTCINYTYTHMTSTCHIRFVFLCIFFFGFFFVLFSHFSRPTMFCYCCCLNNCNLTEKSQYLTKETE